MWRKKSKRMTVKILRHILVVRFGLRVGIAQYKNNSYENNQRGMKVVLWTAWKSPPFLWRDGYSPWSQYATSTINFWILHHHSGCIPNGWRNGGECHGRENLWILAWDKLWKEFYRYRFSCIFYLVTVL